MLSVFLHFFHSVLNRNSAVSFSDSRERHLLTSPLPKHPRFQENIPLINLVSKSTVCEAAPRSLFWIYNGLDELPNMLFEFPFNLIGKSTMAFLTDQSWRVPKSWYTSGRQEQGFRCCFADGLSQSLVLSVAQARCKGVASNHRLEH